MKKLVLLFLLFLMPVVAISQNFEETLLKAKEKNQKIILVFSGLDWCVPCIKLDQKIIQTPEFQSTINKDWMFYNANFPKRKKLTPEKQAENNKLADRYNPNGHFPLVVILDENGNVLGQMGYEAITPNEYLEKIREKIRQAQ